MKYKLEVDKDGKTTVTRHRLLNQVMTEAFAHGLPDEFRVYCNGNKFARMLGTNGRFALVEFEEEVA